MISKRLDCVVYFKKRKPERLIMAESNPLDPLDREEKGPIPRNWLVITPILYPAITGELSFCRSSNIELI